MNPSTAQILEAVERCPAEDVVVLPNNKNIVPVARAGRRAHRAAGRGGADARRSSRRSPRWSPTTRRPRPRRQRGGDDRGRASASRTGEVTQAVRDSVADCGPIAAGDWIAVAARRHPRRRQVGCRRGHRAARRASSTTTAELVTVHHRGRGARRRHGAARGARRRSRTRTSRSRSTTAASRCTRTSSASSKRGGRRASRCASWRAQPVTELKRGRAEARRRGSRRWASRTVARPARSTTRAATTTARNTPEIAELAVGEEATVFARGEEDPGRRDAPAPRHRRGRGLRRHRRTCAARVLQPGVARAAARRRHRGRVLRARSSPYRGKRQMTNPVVDVLEPGEPATNTGVIVPVYPQSGKADVYTWQLRKLVARVLCSSTRARGFADPLDDRAAVDRTASSTATARYAASTSPRRSRTTRRAAPAAEVRRVPAHAGRARRAQARARAGQAAASRHAVDGPLVDRVPRAAAVRAHRRPAARDRRDRCATSRAPAPMHRLLQGEVGSGKTVVALAALLVAVQGGYQGAFMAPTEVLAEQHYLTCARCLDGLTVAGAGHAARRAAGARRAAHEPHDRRRAAPHRRRACATASGRHRRRHARAHLRRASSSPTSAWP